MDGRYCMNKDGFENKDEVKLIPNDKNEDKKTFYTCETFIIALLALIVGLLIGRLLNSDKTITKQIINDDELREFVESYDFVVNNYYEEVDKKALIKNAIAGMMQSLDDPYSTYMDENQSSNFSITLDGSYEGVGIEVSKNTETGDMIVVSVFKDTPAFNAGINAGDFIVSIDGISVKELSAQEFTSKVRNSSTNTIELLRDGSTFTVELSKEKVELISVLSKTYNEGDKKIGYIYIGLFASNTYSQFKNELDKLESENIDTLIIDVRGNTGGHLTTVDLILDLFLNKNQVMYMFEQNGKIEKTYGTGNEKKKYDIVLLADESSASASEVLIGGLKDNLNSILIGKKTYGKGTVQELVELDDGTQYKITVKKWLTPNGTWVNDNKGISPDIEVELGDKYLTTGNDEDDTQLMKALEYIKSNK